MTEMKGQVPVITIDGPTASGKGTVASKVSGSTTSIPARFIASWDLSV